MSENPVGKIESLVADSPIARGPNFVYAREFVKERHGESIWEQVLQGLEPEAAVFWSSSLLVTGRYSFSSLLDMTRVLCGLTGMQGREEVSEMYAHIADRSLNTVYRFFLRFSQPSFVISHYPTLWNRFFESGRVEVPEATQGAAKLVFELPSIFLDWLPPACLGYSRKAIELAGGRNVRLEEESREMTSGDTWRVVFLLEWAE